MRKKCTLMNWLRLRRRKRRFWMRLIECMRQWQSKWRNLKSRRRWCRKWRLSSSSNNLSNSRCLHLKECRLVVRFNKGRAACSFRSNAIINLLNQWWSTITLTNSGKARKTIWDLSQWLVVAIQLMMNLLLALCIKGRPTITAAQSSTTVRTSGKLRRVVAMAWLKCGMPGISSILKVSRSPSARVSVLSSTTETAIWWRAQALICVWQSQKLQVMASRESSVSFKDILTPLIRFNSLGVAWWVVAVIEPSDGGTSTLAS